MPKPKNPPTTAEEESAPAKEAKQDPDAPTPSPPQDDTVQPFAIPSTTTKPVSCERHGQLDESATLIFTHGAGGGISAPACRDFAQGFSTISPILCFQGNLNLQSRLKAFHAVLDHFACSSWVALGGRSMGARAAVLTALEREERPETLILVSYPLMAGSKGEKREFERREKILLDLEEGVDVLFMVGEKDAQCDLEQLAGVRKEMNARSWLVEVKGADHGMSVRPKRAEEAMRRKTGEVAAEWLQERDEAQRYTLIEWDDEAEAVKCGEWQ